MNKKWFYRIVATVVMYCATILIIPPDIRVYFFPPKNIQIINKIFKSNYPINKKGITPLHKAAANNDLGEIKKLLDNGANINIRSKNGNTPLIYAAIYGSNESFEYLLKNKADYKIKSKLPSSAVNYALNNQNVTMIRALLSAGYEINGSDEEYSLLSRVCQKKEDSQIFELLIESGADVNTRNTHLEGSLLHMVVDVSMAQRILDLGVSPNAKNVYGETPLHSARNLGIAKLLVNNGANVNAISYKGENPLHTSKYPEVTVFLIDNGTDINKSNTDNKPPILKANFAHEKIPFIKNGANVFVSTLGGGTLLHTTKTSEVAELLIDRGVEVNQEDDNGHTPLFYVNRKLQWFKKKAEFYSSSIEEYEKLFEVLKKHGGKIK